MARHPVTRDQDRRNCLGCALILVLGLACGVAGLVLALAAGG